MKKSCSALFSGLRIEVKCECVCVCVCVCVSEAGPIHLAKTAFYGENLE
jgi:hypothetical protein